MKRKTILTIAVAALAGYLIAKDKAQKELVKTLVKQNAFNDRDESCE